MRYRDYLRLEGTCSVVLGAALALVAFVLLARSSGWLVFGSGLDSVAFGAVQALAARARAERERGERYVVARRRGVGTPRLGIERAEGAGG